MKTRMQVWLSRTLEDRRSSMDMKCEISMEEMEGWFPE